MMKPRFVTVLLIALTGYSALAVEGRVSKQDTLRDFSHHASLLVDNHLIIGDVMLPLASWAQSLWYGAFQTQILYQSLGSLVSIGSGYKAMLTPYFIYGGHAYLDFGQRLLHTRYDVKLNIGLEAHYRLGILGTINVYLPLQNDFTKPEKTYAFQGHQKIETCYLEQNQKSIDAHLMLMRLKSIKPFLGFYYHHQHARASLPGITIGSDVTLFPSFTVGLRYNFDQFHKHYIRLGLQYIHQHHQVDTTWLQEALWKKPVRYIAPLDMQKSQATEQQYFFFKNQDCTSPKKSEATFENPSPILTQTLVDQAHENAIFQIENSSAFMQIVDTFIKSVGPNAHVLCPENAAEWIQKLSIKKRDITRLCDGQMEYITIKSPLDSTQKPILILSKFPNQEFAPHSNAAVEIILKSGQQLIGTTKHFSEKPRYSFERPTLRQVLNLASNTKVQNVNLYPLNQSSAHTVREQNTDSGISTNTGIIVHGHDNIEITNVDLLGFKHYPYRTGIELLNSKNSKLQNLHVRNAHTGMAIKKSPDTRVDNITIGRAFTLDTNIIELPISPAQYGMIIEDNSDNTKIEKAFINSQVGIDVKNSNIALHRSKLSIGGSDVPGTQKKQNSQKNKRSTFNGVLDAAAIRIFNKKRCNEDGIAIENRLEINQNIMDIHGNHTHRYITAVSINGYSNRLSIRQNQIQYLIDPQSVLSAPIPQYLYIESSNNIGSNQPVKDLTLVDNQYSITSPQKCFALLDTLKDHPKDWIVQNNHAIHSNNGTDFGLQLNPKQLKTTFMRQLEHIMPTNTLLPRNRVNPDTAIMQARDVQKDSSLTPKDHTPKYYIPDIGNTLPKKTQLPPIETTNSDLQIREHRLQTTLPAASSLNQEYLEALKSGYQVLSIENKIAATQNLISALSPQDMKITKLVVKIHKALWNNLSSQTKAQVQHLRNQWTQLSVMTHHPRHTKNETSQAVNENYLRALQQAYQSLKPADRASVIRELESLIPNLTILDMEINIDFIKKIYQTITVVSSRDEKDKLDSMHAAWSQQHPTSNLTTPVTPFTPSPIIANQRQRRHPKTPTQNPTINLAIAQSRLPTKTDPTAQLQYLAGPRQVSPNDRYAPNLFEKAPHTKHPNAPTNSF